MAGSDEIQARRDDMEQVFATMLVTGLRPAEARGLRWEDVELDGPAPAIQVRQQVIELRDEARDGQRRRPRKRVFGTPKSEHGRRTIPLIPRAVAALHVQHKRVA